ncbi:TonB-dependent receptor domain-containing protein [Bacteroidota bacterium]
MIKYYKIILLLFMGVAMSAQTTVTGIVVDSESGIPIPDVHINVVGDATGVTTNFDGEFSIVVDQQPPFELKASSVGYQEAKEQVSIDGQSIKFSLNEGTILDEVVVSASRTPERIFESPVTVETMDLRAIQTTASPSYYDALENLKGVDVNTSSLTFKSINTRGFATFSNTRFMQLVDGMDNSSPALNFAVGNLLGISELDIQSVELLPGASSALYGANAFNGILFMNSKNPFDHQGLSLYAKSGVTTQEANGNNEFHDVGVRYAKAISDKFAAKISMSFLEGRDWAATDYRGYENGTSSGSDNITDDITTPYFDRINVYGDEVKTNIKAVATGMVAANLLPAGSDALVPSVDVSRTGYNEKDLTDYGAKSFKADVGLYFRPTGGSLEISYNGKVGTGNTIYQGANRYYLKNFLMQQHKLEVRDDNFFLRAYMTAEDAGDSYDMFFTGVNLNKADAQQWFGTYVGAFLGAKGASAPDAVAHATAREYADANVTLQPGTEAFKTALNNVRSDSDILTGSKFVDKSKIYHADANYNFKDKIEFAEIQVGGSARRYSLNSSGTVFTDADGAINYDEFGAYVQAQKKMLDDKLKFTGSVRYDKAQNFDGFASPRVSLVYNADDAKKHNFRLSYQTGFRNPTTQDQYIGLDVSKAILVGSAPDNLDRYVSRGITIKNPGHPGVGTDVTLSGRDAYENSFTLASLYAFGAAVEQTVINSGGAITPQQAAGLNAGLLKQSDISFVQPEKVSAYELGYRGILNKIVVDFSAYYNTYEDFIGNKTVVSPLYGSVSAYNPALVATDVNTQTVIGAVGTGDYQAFQTYTNSEADVSSYGAAIGLSTKVGAGYELGMNYTWAKFDFDQASDPDYEAGFNTPEHKVKASIANRNVAKNIGFRIDVRWSDSYLWESTFVDAMLPARTTLDAQVSFKMKSLKSDIKVGGANIGGNEYFSAPGSGAIGSQYYISWTANL